MEVIIILKKEDINTGKIGNNYQIVTDKGVTIIFQNDAILELISDYKNDNPDEKEYQEKKQRTDNIIIGEEIPTFKSVHKTRKQ